MFVRRCWRRLRRYECWNMETIRQKGARVVKIIARLKKAYPDARLALDFSNPLELLIALILAAQARDERVNVVTAELFKKYRTPADWADAPAATLQKRLARYIFSRKNALDSGRVPDACWKNLAAKCRITLRIF